MKYLIIVASFCKFKKRMKSKGFKAILLERLIIINLLIKVSFFLFNKKKNLFFFFKEKYFYQS